MAFGHVATALLSFFIIKLTELQPYNLENLYWGPRFAHPHIPLKKANNPTPPVSAT